VFMATANYLISDVRESCSGRWKMTFRVILSLSPALQFAKVRSIANNEILAASLAGVLLPICLTNVRLLTEKFKVGGESLAFVWESLAFVWPS